jgi:tetratricopeptide (TPR) repeat protein
MPSDSLAEATKRELVAASLLSVKGEYKGAVDRYRKLLLVEPSNAAIFYALSKAYVGLGVVDSARLYSEKSVLLNPGNKYYLRVLASIAHQMHDFERASELYRQLVALDPGNPEPLSSLALEYLAADQPEKALVVFQQILAIDPKDKTAQAQVLLMEMKLLHYQDAISTVMGLIEQGDGKEKLQLTLGELYMLTGQYELAFKTFREVLKENPRYIPAWLALFEVSVQTKNRPVFLEDLKQFYKTNKVSLEQKIDLARLFVLRSAQDSAFVEPAYAMIDEINKHHPENGKVYALRGNAKLWHNQGAGAIADFKKALLLEPYNVEIWEDIVAAYLLQKEFRQAEQVVISAKKRLPKLTVRLRVLEGEVHYQSGDIKKAAILFEKALQPKKAKKDKQLYLQAASTLALCYDKLGFPDKSIRLYEAMLEVDSGNFLTMNNLAYILAVQGKELSKAKELALKAVTAEPENASYLDTFGWVLFKVGEYEKAREILEKAVDIDAHEPEIRDHLSKVYEKLGNHQKAEEMKEKMKILLQK